MKTGRLAADQNTSNTTYIPLSNVNVVANSGGLSGQLLLPAPSQTSAIKKISATLAYKGSGADALQNNTAGGWWNGGNGAIDGIQFLYASGNVSSGTIKIYGIV